MRKLFVSTAAAALALAVAGAANAQNYGGQQQYDSYGNQRDSYAPQRDRDYRDRDYRDRESRDYRDRESQDRDYRGQSGRQQQIRPTAAEIALDIESALQARGYDVGVVDGKIDAKARAGIRAYQRDAGLNPNGEASTQLLSHIETNNLRAGGAAPGATGQMDLGTAAGQAVQQLLNRR